MRFCISEYRRVSRPASTTLYFLEATVAYIDVPARPRVPCIVWPADHVRNVKGLCCAGPLLSILPLRYAKQPISRLSDLESPSEHLLCFRPIDEQTLILARLAAFSAFDSAEVQGRGLILIVHGIDVLELQLFPVLLAQIAIE